MMRIDSQAKTIRQLLANTKYKLDYYQREYSWQTTHVTELLNDLSDKFSYSYEVEHEAVDVEGYEHYFLGSIIISDDSGQRYVVDGQQRLTTLTLLLIRIYHLLEEGALKNQVDQLIYSMSFGKEGFNLDVPEWRGVMQALYEGSSFDESTQPKSVQNIALRYRDIENDFDIEKEFEMQNQALPCFVYWLLENVYLVEITAFESKDAYMIFETVNDRGLSLTPADMLRGYLLSNIEEPELRDESSRVWDEQSQALKQLGQEMESNVIKAWLRCQYANHGRDFDRIGSEFHRWVRDSESNLQLCSGSDFAYFIESDFAFYSRWYRRLQAAGKELQPKLESVFYVTQNITFHYPFLLAPLRVEDSEEECIRKIQIVATYIDILICRRIWNLLPITQRLLVDPMFPLIPAIRGKSSSELRDILYGQFDAQNQSKIPGPEIPAFDRNSLFSLQGNNLKKVHFILARMIDYIEVQSGKSSRYPEYVKSTGNNSYEIEHIWANHPEHHLDEFPHEYEFDAYRNRIGGLLLLPKKNNASYGDLPYEGKRKHYIKENLLALSLHEIAYENNPGFKQFIEKSGLSFKSHSKFKKADLDARQKLYLQLAKRIWNPERLRLTYAQEPDLVIEEEETEYSQEREPAVWTAEKIRSLIPPERRHQYETLYNGSKISEFYRRVAELQDMIHQRGWDRVRTPEFRQNYCSFYVKSKAVFGVNLFGAPRFWILLTTEEAERFRSACEFEAHYSRGTWALYPQHATLDALLPILEFAYKKYERY